MKWDNYKTIKKTEWQQIATSFGIEFEENSVVRYLVEKIAEKIGVDDKIVSDNELKKQVVEKLNSIEEVPTEKKEKTTTKKATTKKASTKKVKEAVVEQPTLSRLEQLRKECESYGIAWAEGHTEANLEQVLNSVKSAGAQPISEQPTINTNQSFEITSSNADEVAKAVENAPQPTFIASQNPAFNPLAVPPTPPVNGGYSSSNIYLDTYKNIYINAIRGHWRLLSVNDINEMITRDKQTFKHQVNINPQQPNQAEIWLTEGSASVRIPSDDKNEWLDING